MKIESLAWGYGLIEGPRVDGAENLWAAPSSTPDVTSLACPRRSRASEPTRCAQRCEPAVLVSDRRGSVLAIINKVVFDESI
jgi:hypothetical protein